jgi:hypothetical protein
LKSRLFKNQLEKILARQLEEVLLAAIPEEEKLTAFLVGGVELLFFGWSFSS